jgi:hypothetical protein
MPTVTCAELYETDEVPVLGKAAACLLVRKSEMVENHCRIAPVVEE